MGKNTHLVNIYLKIHNKKNLTMDELGYLAEYDPECFAKTCKNVVYNIPETKSIMEPIASASSYDETEPEPSDRQNIEKILENLKRLEFNDFPVTNVDVDKVKSLLGNLYMELLFPHNDKETFIKMPDSEITPSFDKKA
ncbi:MAG: hypothetical protein HDR24_12475 [Lachnospiraceae bacterium]|nr:hypothetical protein [Lachnospiraceae bacterium]